MQHQKSEFPVRLNTSASKRNVQAYGRTGIEDPPSLSVSEFAQYGRIRTKRTHTDGSWQGAAMTDLFGLEQQTPLTHDTKEAAT